VFGLPISRGRSKLMRIARNWDMFSYNDGAHLTRPGVACSRIYQRANRYPDDKLVQFNETFENYRWISSIVTENASVELPRQSRSCQTLIYHPKKSTLPFHRARRLGFRPYEQTAV
jgi:hypothetical protein